MTPTGITLTPEHDLKFVWSDGHAVRFSLAFLRDNCPCAGCQGETDILGNLHMPLQLPILKPGKYELKAVTPVGNYAVALVWGDSHDTGIYSWQYLLGLEQSLSGEPASDG